MVNAFAFSALLAIAAAHRGPSYGQQEELHPNQYTATAPADVYAAQATAPTSHQTSHVQGKAFNRFVTIWLENTDYDKAKGDPNLAFLASKGITLENYFGVTHPSMPNYLASVGGDHFGVDHDDFLQIDRNTSSVVDLLENKGISWGTYEEDMPYSGFEGVAWVNQDNKKNDYVRKHNPPMIYDANTNDRRLSYQKNLTMFHTDLEQKTLPQWMFITPNMTSDGHDSSVTVAGSWTRGFLEPLLTNEYFMKDTLVLVTFDENHSYSSVNRVFSILLGGAVPKEKVGTSDPHFYNHYSDMSTVEANWGLHTLGRFDVAANVFDLVAKKTGDIYRPNDEATSATPSRFYNSSYAGPYNEEFQTAPFPVPNLFLFSPKTYRTVLPSIAAKWVSAFAFGRVKHNKNSYYTESVVTPDGQHPPPGYAYNNVNN